MDQFQPNVSVAMGVFNCESTVAEALDCILAQTYQSWELIVCDDGSSDRTASILEQYANRDSRVVVLRNEVNQGLNQSLNRCLDRARGQYYARMDGDDRCEPNRLEVLVSTMENEPAISLVSSGMTFFDECGTWGRATNVAYPEPMDFVHGSPFFHAPCMIRKKVLLDVGGYGTDIWLQRIEDYHLWFKLYAAGYRGKNLSDYLYHMRDDKNARHRRTFKSRVDAFRCTLWGYKILKIPYRYYPYALRAILVGLLPAAIYAPLRRRRLKGAKL